MQKLINWLMIVAIAAPLTPRWKVKMNNGSSAILSTAPLMTPTIAYMALP